MNYKLQRNNAINRLTVILNSKIDNYNTNKNSETKREIIELIKDREKIYLLDEKTIKKYLNN